MEVLYTHITKLSRTFSGILGGERKRIPGGRTRPQRVKYFLLEFTKIIYNLPRTDSNCKQYAGIASKVLDNPAAGVL